MSHRRKQTSFPEAFKPKKLSTVKDRDEKRFMVEDAAGTIKRSVEVEREIAEMKERDPDLFTAAKALIDQEIADLKKANAS